ncbi:MAG: HDIG domain-containing protein [Planctomycetia bacterium]|nr:HDIG domain-containing protein [Planctomycetia bacterium]
MIFFGPTSFRRQRAARLSAVGESSYWGRFGEALSDRNVLLRLLICLFAIGVLLLAVEAWRTPFTYRLGDHQPHGVLAQVPFKRVNKFETDRLRAQIEDQVPFVFRLETTQPRQLLASLKSDLEEIAHAETLESVRSSTRSAFGVWTEGDRPMDDMTPEKYEREFRSLKFAIYSGSTFDPEAIDLNQTMPDDMADRVALLLDDMREFLSPLQKSGVVDPFELNRNKIRADHRLAIFKSNEQRVAEVNTRDVAAPSDVLLAEVLRDEGTLGKSWSQFSRLSVIRKPLERWLAANHSSLVSLRYDPTSTQAARRDARQRVPLITDPYNQGDVLVAPMQAIDETTLDVLHDEYDQIERDVKLQDRVIRLVTVFLLVFVLTVLNGYYIVHNEPRITHSLRALAIYLGAIVLAAFLGRILSFDPWRAEIIPLMVTVMILAIAYNQDLATLTAFTLSLLLTLSSVADTGEFVVLMSVAATAIVPLTRVSSRSSLIKIGFWCGAVFFLVTWGTAVVKTPALDVLWRDQVLLLHSLRGAGWCLASGYIVAGSLPFIEATFGIVTDISLLELSHVSHPLLQELVRRAPGTYNHSITVASLAEAAAEKIDANGLLVRVGAYFHDIGKMLKPSYFIENMGEGAESKHEHLNPAMSTLIIIGHVKDGADLAEQHNLPKPIIDFIEQHHGTTLVQYFYHAASKAAESQGDTIEVEESSFRYPGPKPQTREAGVLMLADAVESASRTLSEPTSKRIESLVRGITMDKLLDGQFEESTLTLSELNVIQDSLTKSLISIFHTRIKYPDQRAG